MSALSAWKTVLEADATLLATATGGIWDFDETGRLGISRTLTPTAFDSNGIIKPCVLLKSRSYIPDYVLADDSSQYVSAQEMLEAWFYESNGYTNILTMRNRVYALTHTVQLTGTFQCLWAGHIRPGFRDDDLDAFLERSDYQVFAPVTA